MKIVTLTLNPALDVHCYTPSFRPFHENLCTVTHREAGGKGVNISRALTVNGVENLACVVLGTENGEGFLRSLQADGMTVSSFTVPGSIRENITLHCDDKEETRISFPGFSVDGELLFRVEAALEGEIDADTVVTFTGSNPKGLEMTDLKDFLRRIQAKGAKIVLDSRSFTLDDLIEIKPWLIKPNQDEISAYLGREIHTEEALVAAKDLQQKGIENVMISLGGNGAVLACPEGIFRALPPKVKALSSVGAGDSSIAGFLSAFLESAERRLRTAVAFGTAACLTSGTKPPLPEAIKTVFAQVKIEKL